MSFDGKRRAVHRFRSRGAVRIHRELKKAKRMTGLNFWTRGYCVSTVGLDESVIREYIRKQDDMEKNQLEFGFEYSPKIARAGLSIRERPL